MRALDPAFAAHLQSGVTTLVTCWRIDRRDGAAMGFTEHDRILRFGGVDYEPYTAGEGASLVETADLAVDNTSISGLLSSERLSADDLAAGLFDGARVEIWRVNWAQPSERALLKRGAIGEVRREGARFSAEIRGLAQALDAPQGRIYQRGCDANVGDARCAVALESPAFRFEGAVAAVAGGAAFFSEAAPAFPDGWFIDGRIDWLNGANAGAASVVRAQSGASFTLWAPPGRAIAPGDTFAVHAGCDKSFRTCVGKFANGAQFRGFPFMPGDDAVIAVPRSGEVNDGGKRG